MKKKIISFLLTFAILLSSVSCDFPDDSESRPATVMGEAETETQADIPVVFPETMQEGYNVSGLTVDLDKKTVTALVQAKNTCTLVIRFADEKTYFSDGFAQNRIYMEQYTLSAPVEIEKEEWWETTGEPETLEPAASETNEEGAPVPPDNGLTALEGYEEDCESAFITVQIPITVDLPKYFVAESMLQYEHTDTVIGGICTDVTHTNRYGRFAEKTPDDFAGENVIHFDGASEDNFGVFAPDVKLLEAERVTESEEQYDFYEKGRPKYNVVKPSQPIHAGDKVFIKGKNGGEALMIVREVILYDSNENEIGAEYIAENGEINRYTVPGCEGKTAYSYQISDEDLYGHPWDDLRLLYQYIRHDSLDEEKVTLMANPAPTAPRSTTLQGSGSASGSWSYSGHVRQTASLGGVNVDGSVKASAYIRYKVVYDPSVFGDDYFQIDMDLDLHFSGSGDFDWTAEEDWDMSSYFNPGLKLRIPCNVPGLLVGIEFSGAAGIHGEIAAKLPSINGAADIATGFRYNTKDGFRMMDTTCTVSASGKLNRKSGDGYIDAELSASFGITATLSLSFLRVVKASVSCTAGPTINFKTYNDGLSVDHDYEDWVCCEISYYGEILKEVSASVNLEVCVPFAFELEHEWDLFEWSSKPKRFGECKDLHYHLPKDYFEFGTSGMLPDGCFGIEALTCPFFEKT